MACVLWLQVVWCVCLVDAALEALWDVTKFGADPSGKNDSTAGIQATFNALAASPANCRRFFAPNQHFNYSSS